MIVSNGAGIMYDLNYKIQESFRKFSYDLNQKMKTLVDSMLHIIEESIQIKEHSQSSLEKQFSAIDAQEKMIQHLKKQLEQNH